MPYADEAEPPEEPPSDLQSLLQANTRPTASPVELSRNETLTNNKDHAEVGMEKIPWLIEKVKITLPINMRTEI